MNRVLVLAFALALSVPLVAVTAASGAAQAGGKRSVVFHLVEKQVGSNFIDNPPRQGFNAPPLIGDQFMFTSELMTRTGARAGELDASCMISRGGKNPTGPCYGVFALAGGTLVGIADANFNSNTTLIAIVGGTGVYEGVSGSVKSVSRNNGNSPYTDDTVHIVWPG